MTISRSKTKSNLRQAKRLLDRVNKYYSNKLLSFINYSVQPNLPSDKIVETKRKIKALEYELNKSKESEIEKKYSIKYHKIKFFEKRKLVRLINKYKKNDNVVESDNVNENRIKLNYVIHYPKNEKYISILNKPNNVEDKRNRDQKVDNIKSLMNDNKITTNPESEVFKALTGGSKQNKKPTRSSAVDTYKNDKDDDVDSDEDEDKDIENDEFFE